MNHLLSGHYYPPGGPTVEDVVPSSGKTLKLQQSQSFAHEHFNEFR